MKVDCVLKAYYKPKKDKDDRYCEIDFWDKGTYVKQNYDVQIRLQIVSVSDDGDELEVLREIVFPFSAEDKTHRHIAFHTLTYMHNGDNLFCLTTQHEI